MITKEQAMTASNFVQVAQLNGTVKATYGMSRYFVPDGTSSELKKPINWRANGKCKTWKRNVEAFALPIKHGLYEYGYITEENCHLFEVA